MSIEFQGKHYSDSEFVRRFIVQDIFPPKKLILKALRNITYTIERYYDENLREAKKRGPTVAEQAMMLQKEIDEVYSILDEMLEPEVNSIIQNSESVEHIEVEEGRSGNPVVVVYGYYNCGDSFRRSVEIKR